MLMCVCAFMVVMWHKFPHFVFFLWKIFNCMQLYFVGICFMHVRSYCYDEISCNSARKKWKWKPNQLEQIDTQKSMSKMLFIKVIFIRFFLSFRNWYEMVANVCWMTELVISLIDSLLIRLIFGWNMRSNIDCDCTT